MAKEIWGLDLGEWSLKVVRGSYDKEKDNIRVSLYDEIRYRELGLEEDVSSLERFRAGLKAFGDKYQVAKGDILCVAISGSGVFSRFINLPPVPDSISEIIRYEARQQIPFDINEVVWDYQPVKEEYEPGEEIEVGLFALKRETINEFIAMLEPWRLQVRVIQDGPLALYNLLRFEGLAMAEEPLIVLDMGARTTDVLVLNHPRFWIRSLIVGGDDITERLQSHFGVSRQESERIKARASESAHEAQVLRVIRPVAANMVSEIQRSLGYYKSMARGVRFSKVLALGSAFKLRGLDKLLAEGLQYEIEGLAELKRFEAVPPLDDADFKAHLAGACTALGLLVQGAGQGHMGINLMPEELSTAIEMSSKKPWLVGAAVGLVAIVLLLFVSERLVARELGHAGGFGSGLAKQVAELENRYNSVNRGTQAVKDELAVLTKPDIERDLFMRLIPEITRALPPTIYVWNMQFYWMDGHRLLSMENQRDYQEALATAAVSGAPILRGAAPTSGLAAGSGGASVAESVRLEELRQAEAEDQPTAAPQVPQTMPAAGGKAAFALSTTPAAGGEAGEWRLVLTLDCESTQISKGREYIQNEVVKSLGDLEIVDEAWLASGLRNVHRRILDWIEVTGAPPAGQTAGDVQELVAFQLFVVLNTGGEAEVATRGTSASPASRSASGERGPKTL